MIGSASPSRSRSSLVQLEAARSRHHDLNQRDVRRLVGDGGEGGFRVRSESNGEARPRERRSDEVPEPLVVVDDQHPNPSSPHRYVYYVQSLIETTTYEGLGRTYAFFGVRRRTRFDLGRRYRVARMSWCRLRAKFASDSGRRGSPRGEVLAQCADRSPQALGARRFRSPERRCESQAPSRASSLVGGRDSRNADGCPQVCGRRAGE
jgi:hypothetical protein